MEVSSTMWSFMLDHLQKFLEYTAFGNFTGGHLVMIAVGLIFIYLAIAKEYEPMLLVPIGFGILIGNIPFWGAEHILNTDPDNLQIGLYHEGSVLNYLYFGVRYVIYQPLIFLLVLFRK